MKNIKQILIGVIFFTILCLGNVYAKTISNINPCEFQATLRLLKLLGLVIIAIKILVPLLLIFMCIKDTFKPIMSGKPEDLAGLVPTFFKRIAAGLIIFFIPTIVNYCTNNLVEFDDSAYKECTTCLFEPNNCVIPDKDPDTYVED